MLRYLKLIFLGDRGWIADEIKFLRRAAKARNYTLEETWEMGVGPRREA